MICSGCFFILGYASTWAPGIWLFCGETFASKTRAKQAALATLSNWIWNFMLAFFTTPIVNDIGFAYGVSVSCQVFICLRIVMTGHLF